jgi:hypothetical protein
MAHDTTPRYAPSEFLTVNVQRDGWTVSPVAEYVVHPPGTHPKSPISNDKIALECKLTPTGVRWFGCDRAYINSELRMVVVGFDDRDGIRRRWEVCTNP